MPGPPRRSRRILPTWAKALTAVAAPVAFLALLELGLAVGGYQARGPGNIYDRFSRHKPRGTVRILVVGASAAAGWPLEAKCGPVPFLRVLLRDVAPGQPTQVLCCAVSALTSEGVLMLVRRLADYEPDVVIVYCGHNEFFSMPGLRRLVAGWDPEPPPWPLRTRIVALLRDMAVFVRGGPPPEDERTRAELAQTGQIASPRDYEPDSLAPAYEARLREIVLAARRGGAKVLLSTLASNLRDSPPTQPQHRAGLAPEQLAAWDAAYTQGRALAKAGDAQGALAAFARAAAIDGSHAGLLFEIGRQHHALGHWPEARTALAAARDRDYIPMRATTPRNEAVRRVARSLDVPLADALAAFDAAAPGGIPGDDLFVDHVHLSLEGAWTLARCWASALETQGMLGPSASWDWSRARPREACETALGLTDTDRAAAHRDVGRQYALGEHGGRLVAAFRRPQLVESLRRRGRRHFAEALRLDPTVLQGFLADFEPYTHCYIALACVDLGQPDRGVEICQEVLDVAPGFALAYEVLAEAHAARGDKEGVAAARQRLRALQASSNGGRTHSIPGEKER